MINIQGLSLILTNKCNASCKHCGFSCGPDKNETMSIEDAIFYIHEAKKLQTLKMVCFTGGEPFLFYDRVVQMMSYGNKLGLTSEIVTNSFWATTYDVAMEKLEELKKIGLVNFVTSLDDFHLEFIDINKIKNAVRAALDLRLHVTVKTLEFEHCQIKAENVADLLGVLENTNFFKLQKVSPVREGRYKEFSNHFAKNINIEEVDFVGGCSTIIKFPAVKPNGELYPCCGFSDDSRFTGVSTKDNFSELLYMMQNNLLFNLLGTIGPYGVLQLVNKYLTEPVVKDFYNPCEICNYLYSSEEIKEAVNQVMQELMKGII